MKTRKRKVIILIILCIIMYYPIDAYIKEKKIETQIINQINIRPHIKSKIILLDILNQTNITFKNLGIICQFKIGDNKDITRTLKVYSVFRGGYHRVIKDYYASDLLEQSRKITCKADDLELIDHGKVKLIKNNDLPSFPYQYKNEEHELRKMLEQI